MRLSEILPDDFDGRDSIVEKYNDDPAAALSAFRSLQKEFSSTRRVPQEPGVDAPDDEWTSYYEKLGVPKSSDGYQLPEVEDAELAEVLGSLRDSFHGARVPAEAWDSISGSLTQMARERSQRAEVAFEEQINEYKGQLRERLGNEKAEETLALAQRYQNQAFGNLDNVDPGVRAILKVIGSHPVTVQVLADAARAGGGDRVPHGEGGEIDSSHVAKEAANEYMKYRAYVYDNKARNEAGLTKEMVDARLAELSKVIVEAGFEGGVSDPRLQKIRLT